MSNRIFKSLLRVYFQKYTKSTPKVHPKYTRSTPEVHHEYRTDTHGVTWKFFQKGVLVYFFLKNHSMIVYEGFLIRLPYRRNTLARFLFINVRRNIRKSNFCFVTFIIKRNKTMFKNIFILLDLIGRNLQI